MIKIIVLLLSLGLSFLTTYLINPINLFWLVNIGLFLGYVLFFILLFFLISTIITLPYSRKTPEHYNSKAHNLYNGYVRFANDLFGVKVKVYGLEMLPDEKCIIFHNHRTNTDPMILSNVLRKRDSIFVAKESLKKIPWFGRLISATGYVFLNRKDSKADYLEIIRGIRWLKQENVDVVIAIEGKRNKTYPNPLLLDFKHGCVDFATKNNAPMVVCVISGQENIKKGLLFKTHIVSVDFIKTIYPDEYKDLTSEQISNNIRELMLNHINKKLN